MRTRIILHAGAAGLALALLAPLPALASGCSTDLSQFATYRAFAATSSGKSAKAQEIQAAIAEFQQTMPATVVFAVDAAATALRDSTIGLLLEAERGLRAIQDVREGRAEASTLAQNATYGAIKGLLDGVFGTVAKGARVTLSAVQAAHVDMVAAQGRATPVDVTIAEVLERSVARAAALERAVETMNATAAAQRAQDLTEIAAGIAALADHYAN